MHRLPGARMGSPVAHAQGAVAVDILGRLRARARARQQIKISQNSGTPVPKRGENYSAQGDHNVGSEGFDSGGCALMRALWTSLCLKVKGAKRSMIEHVIE